MKKINIVTIGGGTGQFSLLKSLMLLPMVNLTAVVAMADSGGSTGVLRDQYGVLPPGDILKCLIALSPLKEAREILQTRFKTGQYLKNHNAGNLLLTFLTEHTGGDFPQAIKVLAEILQVRGQVLPVTIHKVTLVAELSDGSRLYGEAAIDVPRGNGRRAKIIKTYLVPHHDQLEVYPPVINAINQAEVIILGPGDLYTSLVPNLLIATVARAINQNKRAKYIYIANLMTKYGETDQYQLADFINEIKKYVPRKFDFVLVNNCLPRATIINKYLKQKAHFIKPPQTKSKNIIATDLISESGGIVRHDIAKLSRALTGLIK